MQNTFSRTLARMPAKPHKQSLRGLPTRSERSFLELNYTESRTQRSGSTVLHNFSALTRAVDMARRPKLSDLTRREQRTVQILLAEDSLGDVVLVRKALEAINIPFELRVVSDGEELLNYLVNALELDGQNSLPFPDVVLIDLNMPKLDGFKALELISQQEACSQLPLVVISSSSASEDVSLAYELGADGFIDKTLGPAGFIEQLKFIEHYWSREGKVIYPGSTSRH